MFVFKFSTFCSVSLCVSIYIKINKQYYKMSNIYFVEHNTVNINFENILCTDFISSIRMTNVLNLTTDFFLIIKTPTTHKIQFCITPSKHAIKIAYNPTMHKKIIQLPPYPPTWLILEQP